MQDINPSLQTLLVRFNGQILIPILKASECIGLKEQTVRNRLCLGTYPIPVVPVGIRKFIHINDLADYLESLRAPKIVTTQSNQSRKGRPPKLNSKKVQGNK